MELKQYNLFFLCQETFALTKRLFIQLKRRPSTLLVRNITTHYLAFLFGALFSKAPEVSCLELILMGISRSRTYSFTTFSGALNSGLPLMFDREFGFLNRLLVAPLTSKV